jgi:hypothetical protein
MNTTRIFIIAAAIVALTVALALASAALGWS